MPPAGGRTSPLRAAGAQEGRNQNGFSPLANHLSSLLHGAGRKVLEEDSKHLLPQIKTRTARVANVAGESGCFSPLLLPFKKGGGMVQDVSPPKPV